MSGKKWHKPVYSMATPSTTTRNKAKMQEQSKGTGNADNYNARFDELDTKLDKLLELHTTTNALLNTVVGRVDTLDLKTESIATDVHDQGVKLDAHEVRVSELEKKLQQATDYIDLLENKHREMNLKLLNAGEGSEKGMSMISFLVKTLEENWSLKLEEEDFEKAHRIGSIKDKAKYPRAIIFKLHHFQKRQLIWKQTREKRDGGNLKIVMDSSVLLRKKVAEYWPLREQLHQMKMKTYIKHPATLCVMDEEDVTMSFTSLDEAKQKLKEKHPSIK